MKLMTYWTVFFTKAATQNKEVSNFMNRLLNIKNSKMVTEMVNKIEEIIRRIEALEKCKDTLGLKRISKEKLSWRTPSTCLIEGEIYGRENDKEAMIKLLKDENTDANISVIPIVGMGGVGKTTLAQWLYNNEDLMKEFDLKVWVCVSQDFKIVKITQTIIEAVTSRPCDMKDLNLLQLDLKDKLIGKKFFIILDDVWNEDYDDWNNLERPFQYGIKGSKILVTTRSKKVASIVQTCPPYEVNVLSNEYCWSVFTNHACFPEFNGNPTLEKIGREIVKNCKGLPLAAQTLGGLLRVKHDFKEWNAILTSEIWEFSVEDSKIVPALLISYYHLPPHLKRCFVYCSLYPKYYKFRKHELTLLWMAEDLLLPPKRGQTLEEVGYECFDDLASRFFFKLFSAKYGSFVMHDLIHDLATSVAGEFYFRLEGLRNADEMSTRTRHLSYGRLSHPTSIFFDAIGRVKSLRTFLPIVLSPLFSIGSTEFFTLSECKWLRVLSIASFLDLDVLPDSIGELIHLRYLDLSKTRIKTLPESLSNLYNLQTLKLCSCRYLTMLPNGMQNLVNLRHLDIRGTNLKEMPRGMSKLKNLQHLDYFVVGKHEEENGMMELGELSNIHGSLSIMKLENVACSSEALKARIMDKTHIKRLKFKWSTGGDMVPSISSQVERDIFDKLQPHKGLQVLTIEGYMGTIFPDWIGHFSYHSMIHISLASCRNCCMLPSLGQLPSLKSLEIRDFDGLVMIGYESESNAFPQLKKLRISNCPRLMRNLPNHLPALETLEINRCNKLISSLPKAPMLGVLSLYKSGKVELQEMPHSVKSVSMGGYEVVKSMFQGMSITRLTSLQSLSINDCSCAISFPGDRIPVSVKALCISNCRKVEFPSQQQNELLISLSIKNSCDSLTSFPLDSFPNLKSLKLQHCRNLESLLVSQPQDVALHRLEIIRCSKFKSLPYHMNTFLPKLNYLLMMDCPEIELFPDGGLPLNLKSIKIYNCEKLLSNLSSMGVLEGLTNLHIGGPCESVESFPKEGLLRHLPSLKELYLYGLSNVETLDCKELLHLIFLQQLTITECPKLENMTGERLPASLIELEIHDSPLLEERSKMKHLQIWPKISHIPHISVNFISIT